MPDAPSAAVELLAEALCDASYDTGATEWIGEATALLARLAPLVIAEALDQLQQGATVNTGKVLIPSGNLPVWLDRTALLSALPRPRGATT